ncbi:MAG: penicillin-binding transpeptidase domain-containing protein, partial [Lachnospiraceae bacterium]|nr:penicillin-binding transpeptidase domain-containing protein [Lachnospiraceae bacterium]
MKKRRRPFRVSRPLILCLFFVFLSVLLVHRLYVIQIIHGESYRNNFSMKTTRTRTIRSTRGNIYDRNGKLLAYNKLSNSLTLEDSGTYSTNRLRDLSLNGEAYRISKILKEHGDSLNNDFHVVLDEKGRYTFNVEGTSLDRFRADVYGRAKIADMKPEEAESSAEDMIEKLCSASRFGIVRAENPYTEKELTAAGLPLALTRSEILDIIYVRYQLFTTQYRKYMPVTIAVNLSDASVAALSEEKDTLTGIEIVQETTRIYNYPEAFASLIGYTGKVSSEELTELQAKNSRYTRESVVGKSGIEKVYEGTLQGSDGQETVYVDRFGKVLQIDERQTIKPTAGGNVYLTIDADLQVATYKILEQRIAGVLEHVIIDSDEFDAEESSDRDSIRIPIKDVYNAIFENGVMDIAHLSAEDASETERAIWDLFLKKQEEVFKSIYDELTGTNPLPYNELSDEMKEYESYIVNEMLMSDTKILSSSKIDKTDETYLAWTRDETISLKEYLTYAASRNWIDISAISSGEAYLDSAETYAELSDYIEDYLSTDLKFTKILFKYMIEENRLTGKSIMLALYDQGVFNKKDGTYESFVDGEIESYELVLSKINSLELTPAMLALDPCSGSAVVTDSKSGEIMACVTYPGYDNNRLANKMDVAYYRKLAADASGPFYNKATQQETAPGSTFKLITTAAGLEEHAVNTNTIFNCTGTFDLTETPLKCWLTSGHGPLNILGGIQNSCNVFFCNVAYTLGTNEEGNWSDSLSLGKLRQYSN